MGIEVTSESTPSRDEVLARARDTPETFAESNRDEASVLGCCVGIDERRRASSDDQHACIDGWNRDECASRQPTNQTRLEEGSPVDAVEGARPGQSALDRDVPLDDEVCALHPSLRLQEHLHEIARPVERRVRNYPERLGRQRYLGGVSRNDVDVVPPFSQGVRERRVELDRDDPAGYARELLGEPSTSGSDVENEVASSDPGIAHELGSESVASKEVLTTRRRPSRPLRASGGHGSGEC